MVYQAYRIFFSMKAPTNGCLAIGFNTTGKMTKAYLLMGRGAKNKAEVVEHYTIAPGKYKPIKTFGGALQVKDVQELQNAKATVMQFALPENATGQYQNKLFRGNNYVMVLAYS